MNDSVDTPPMELDALQLQLWLGQQRNPASTMYNMAIASTIEASIDPLRFEQAWARVVQLFPDLTSIIVERNGEPRRLVTGRPIPVQRADASANDEALIQGCARTPFDLAQSLCRALLIRQSETRWVWVLCAHHMVCDADSFALLWQNLREQYQLPDKAGAQAVPAPRLASAQATAPLSTAAATYWQARAEPPEVDFYGAGRARGGPLARRIDLAHDPVRQAGLQNALALPAAASFSADLSKCIVLATACFAHLYRVSGQADLAIGLLVSHRRAQRGAKLPGLSVEIVPLAVTVAAEDTFLTLMEKVRAELLNAMRHVEPGASTRIDQNRLRLVLNIVGAELGDFGLAHASHEWVFAGHIDSHHLMRVHLSRWHRPDQLDLAFELNEAELSGARGDRAVAHWLNCLDTMLAQPDTALGAVALADASPTAWASAQVAGAQAADVLSRIVAIAGAHPQQTALTLGTHTMSYAGLAQAAARVAAALQAQGVGAGQRVAVHLPREMALMPAILGVMATGAAYVPVDITQPAARLAFLLDNSDVACVLTNKTLAPSMPAGVPALAVDALLDAESKRTEPGTEDIAALAANLLASLPAPQEPAYVLYTSGSTGQPKGVVVSRAAMANYCHWAADYYCQNKPHSFALFTSIGFDLTLTSMFVPLMVGGSIRVYPESAGPAELGLLDVVADNAVDIVKLTPAHLALLQTRDLTESRIGQFIVGGEDFKTELAQTIDRASGGKLSLHNEYGPTEATVGCIVHTYDPQADTGQSVLIGKPVAGMTAYLLNAQGMPQPPDVAGELWLAGPSLADGYWGRTDLTDESFVDDPFQAGRKMYRTGDLARADGTGQLVYLGRTDDQVKIKGVRIELSEIEAAALAHPGVVQSVATTTEVQRAAHQPERFCVRCGVSSRNPEVVLHDDDVCNLCVGFAQYRERAGAYFRTYAELERLAARIRQAGAPKYDCMMLLSGGKDSTYALARLVDMKLRVLAFTLDNGFISDSAKDNIQRVCETLGVDHHYGSTPAMNEIFVDSLTRYANVCNGCFKTIYTLGMKLADEMSIPVIVTGLSRGQFFETRLSAELFTTDRIDVAAIDDAVLSARKAYHRVADAPARLLGAEQFQTDEIFERVRYVDFYRYCDVTLDEMLAYLDKYLPWVRPADTGRSTNCLINDVGIYVHKLERGYHNYSMPYSWDVRLGHKQRDAALEELDDKLDVQNVRSILHDIGYEPRPLAAASEARLALYYDGPNRPEPEAMRAWLAERLPTNMMPAYLVGLAAMPLNANGKIARSALPPPTQSASAERTISPPQTPAEHMLAKLWGEVLDQAQVSLDDNFFEVGGDSLLAIRLVARLNESNAWLKPVDIFEHQTLGELAALMATRAEQAGESIDAANAGGRQSGQTERFGAISAGQKAKLGALLAGRKPKR